MSNKKRLTPAGAEIVDALTDFCEALEQGPDAVTKRFTVRTVQLGPKPQSYVAEEAKTILDLTGVVSNARGKALSRDDETSSK